MKQPNLGKFNFFLGFVCEFEGEGRGGFWREENREKIRKNFKFFEKVFFIENNK
jgi:hypothetical protein